MLNVGHRCWLLCPAVSSRQPSCDIFWLAGNQCAPGHAQGLCVTKMGVVSINEQGARESPRHSGGRVAVGNSRQKNGLGVESPQ